VGYDRSRHQRIDHAITEVRRCFRFSRTTPWTCPPWARPETRGPEGGRDHPAAGHTCGGAEIPRHQLRPGWALAPSAFTRRNTVARANPCVLNRSGCEASRRSTAEPSTTTDDCYRLDSDPYLPRRARPIFEHKSIASQWGLIPCMCYCATREDTPKPIAAQNDATESGRVGFAADELVAVTPGESPYQVHPELESGLFDPDSVDLARHWGWAHLHAAA
jgi:hypothetical protein